MCCSRVVYRLFHLTYDRISKELTLNTKHRLISGGDTAHVYHEEIKKRSFLLNRTTTSSYPQVSLWVEEGGGWTRTNSRDRDTCIVSVGWRVCSMVPNREGTRREREKQLSVSWRYTTPREEDLERRSRYREVGTGGGWIRSDGGRDRT